MIEQIRQLANRENSEQEVEGEEPTRLLPLWAVAAQLVLATGAGATLEHLAETDSSDVGTVPKGLAWAPLLIAPLAAAANLSHAKHPTDRSETAMRFLTGATIGFGAALFAFDAVTNRDRAARRIAPLAFASAGVLGLLIDREEREIRETEDVLKKRARIVERLIPQRKTKFDRLVVHV